MWFIWKKTTPWFWKKHCNEFPNIQNNLEYIQNHPKCWQKIQKHPNIFHDFPTSNLNFSMKPSPPSESWRNSPPGSVAMYPTSVATPRRLDFDAKRCWHKLRDTKLGLRTTKKYKVVFFFVVILWTRWFDDGDVMVDVFVLWWGMVILWMRWCDDADVNLMSRFLLMFIGDVVDISILWLCGVT